MRFGFQGTIFRMRSPNAIRQLKVNVIMIVVMKSDAGEGEINHVIETIQNLGLKAHVSRGEERTVIGAIGDESKLRGKPLESFPGVDSVTPIQKPYKLASRQMHPHATQFNVNGVKIGGEQITVI